MLAWGTGLLPWENMYNGDNWATCTSVILSLFIVWLSTSIVLVCYASKMLHKDSISRLRLDSDSSEMSWPFTLTIEFTSCQKMDLSNPCEAPWYQNKHTNNIVDAILTDNRDSVTIWVYPPIFSTDSVLTFVLFMLHWNTGRNKLLKREMSPLVNDWGSVQTCWTIYIYGTFDQYK